MTDHTYYCQYPLCCTPDKEEKLTLHPNMTIECETKDKTSPNSNTQHKRTQFQLIIIIVFNKAKSFIMIETDNTYKVCQVDYVHLEADLGYI